MPRLIAIIGTLNADRCNSMKVDHIRWYDMIWHQLLRLFYWRIPASHVNDKNLIVSVLVIGQIKASNFLTKNIGVKKRKSWTSFLITFCRKPLLLCKCGWMLPRSAYFVMHQSRFLGQRGQPRVDVDALHTPFRMGSLARCQFFAWSWWSWLWH